MRIKLIKYTTAVVAGACLFQACTKQEESILSSGTNSNFDGSTIAQVFVATVNASRNYVYVDGKAVTGAALTSGSVFPASGYGFNVGAGNRAFLVQDTLRTSTQLPLSFGENMQLGRHYTIFMYDTINSPKQKTVEDNIVVPSDTSARLRFANFIYNPFAVPAIDVFSFNLNRNIFTNVAVTDVTSFIPYPSRLATDTLYIRETGTSVNIIKLAITGGLTFKRSYTLVYRGSHRGTRTTTLFANY